MGIFHRLKKKAKALKQELTALYYACLSPETPGLARVLLFITLGYALSPIDLIPDFIPLLGYIDDLLILPGLIMLTLKLIPHEIMTESRNRALREPISLKKNRLFAFLFVLIWLLIVFILIRFFWDLF